MSRRRGFGCFAYFAACLLLLVGIAGPAAANSTLSFDLSDPGAVPLQSTGGQYAVTLNQPTADPSFRFQTGDVIEMSGRATFSELFGRTRALLVFTSFRQAPTVGCGDGAPPPRLAVAAGADVNPGPSTHQGSAIVSSPDGTICSTELDGDPFLAMVFEDVEVGEEREFAFDLVLEAPMVESAGMRVLYKGYAVVPEPSATALVAFGIAFLIGWGRRR